MNYYTKETFQNYVNQTLQTLDYSLDQVVLSILENVKKDGDQALIQYTKAFDHVDLNTFVVSKTRMKEAYDNSSDTLKQALLKAINNIKRYHEKQRLNPFEFEDNGRLIGQKVTPLDRVGVYIPGGTATYPSTVLMNVIPAQIAGVKSIALITPPNQEGNVSSAILTACYMLGIDEVYSIGGAQGIAALTYGTKTIKRVDKIVGPGNRYVAAAKKLVSGLVGIDSIAGPSEVCIVCDQSSNPRYVASDMLAQAEHDTYAKAVVISTSLEMLKSIEKEVNNQLKSLKRSAIASESIKKFGALVYAKTIEEAFDIINLFAPEHLEIQLENPLSYLDRVKHAGAVFLGPYTPEPVGDYMAGPNHTLPTSSTARYSSGLSTYDFLKRTSYVYYSKEAFIEDSESIITLAETESLEGHAQSIKVRL
jgi:histidinol dehydrogenase